MSNCITVKLNSTEKEIRRSAFPCLECLIKVDEGMEAAGSVGWGEDRERGLVEYW